MRYIGFVLSSILLAGQGSYLFHDFPSVVKDRTFELHGCQDSGITTYNSNDNGIVSERACTITLKAPIKYSSPFSFKACMDRGLDIILNRTNNNVPLKSFGRYLIGVVKGYGEESNIITLYIQTVLTDYLKNFFELIYQTFTTHDMYALGKYIQSQLKPHAWAQHNYVSACFCILEGPVPGIERVPLVPGRSYTRQEIKNGYKEIHVPLYKGMFSNLGNCRALIIRKNQVVFSTHDHRTPQMVQEKYWGKCATPGSSGQMIPDVYLFGIPTISSNVLLDSHEKLNYLLTDDIIVFGTPEVWKVFNNEEIAAYIKREQNEGKDLQTIADEMAEKGAYDKLTLIMVKI